MPVQKQVLWTKERIAQFDVLYAAGIQRREMVEKLGIPFALIDSRIKSRKKMADGSEICEKRAVASQANKFWNEERIAKLREMHAEGYSASQIAEAIGAATRNAVIGKSLRLGLEGRRSSKVPPKSQPRTKRKPEWRPQAKVESPPIAIADESHSVITYPERFRRSLLTLNNESCRFPVGEVGTDGFFYCGRPGADLLENRPYCGMCSALVHSRNVPRQNRFIQRRWD
jgi:GcrA cell cycle regulator